MKNNCSNCLHYISLRRRRYCYHPNNLTKDDDDRLFVKDPPSIKNKNNKCYDFQEKDIK